MNYSSDLIKKEEKRFYKLLEYVKSTSFKERVEGNLKFFLNIEDNQYQSNIDLENTIFSITSYSLDNINIYQYKITFNDGKYYNSLILTNKSIKLNRDNLSFIDERFKVEKEYPPFYIGIPLITKGVITNIFSDPNWTGSPFVVYGSTNIDLLKNFNEKNDSCSFAEYYNQFGELICELDFGANERYMVISRDGNASKEYIDDWLEKNFNKGDDSTRLVEIAGYYHTSKILERIVHSIKL